MLIVLIVGNIFNKHLFIYFIFTNITFKIDSDLQILEKIHR